MLIARNTTFGPPNVIQLIEVPTPEPKDREVLIRVQATTVSAADSRLRSRNVPRGFGLIMGLLFGFSRPKYQALGTELAGEVVKTGSHVTRFKVGDRVVANTGMKLGGHAQFVALREDAPMARLPASVTDAQAAALVFGGTTALAFLRDKAKLQRGERLLVIGAGGAVGSAAVQLGKYFGAHVTAVCSAEKHAAVKALGADTLIDYAQVDWRKLDAQFDVILDTVGGTNFENARAQLTPRGRLLLVVADLPLMLKSAWISLTHPQKAIAGSISENSRDLEFLVKLCEAGAFVPLIGQVVPFSKIVEAHALVDRGHKLGACVLTPQTL